MKRLAAIWSMTAVAAASLATSCIKSDADNATPASPAEAVPVAVSLSVAQMTAGDDATRAAISAGDIGTPDANPAATSLTAAGTTAGTAGASNGASASASASAAATRTIPTDLDPGGAYNDATPIVENMWIIQFDGNSSTSLILGAPRFVDKVDLPLLNNPNPYPLTVTVPLVQTAGPAYTLFVANIGAGDLFNWNLSQTSTFTDVATRVKTLVAESDSWEAFATGTKTMLMSAVTTTQVKAGTTLYPIFDRNVAKVTLNLSIDAAATGMSIASVRLRNVSNTISLAESALTMLGVGSTTIWPTNEAPIDYPPLTTGLPAAAGQSVKLSWYVPRNQQGVAAISTDAWTKTAYAPVNATYFEIMAVKASRTSVFRVYPGANMENDFDITPNKHYTVNLNVVDIGTDPADSRVQTFGTEDYTWATTSNSFIINPAPTGGQAIKCQMPITQVNNFWGGTAAGYGNTPSKKINAGDAWTVSMIWSDLATLFSTTASTTAITLSKATGSGPTDYFELSVPAGLPAGNFLVGIKKTGDPAFLWSWHFWVTDYAPDKFHRSAITAGKYTYPVPGGQVERYGAPPSGIDLWSPGPTGIYSNSVSMDRTLGAVETFFTKQPATSDRGMLYYQWGRKDPFPIVPLTGTAITAPNGQTTIAGSVANPTVFYVLSGTLGGPNNSDWKTDSNTGTLDMLWNDPNAPTAVNTGKSIYDPCPPGWKMPIRDTYNDFTRQVNGAYANIQNPQRDLGYNYGRGIGSPSSLIVGMRYWPGTTGLEPAGGRIWFPAMGYRHGAVAGGSIYAMASFVDLWLATPIIASGGDFYGIFISCVPGYIAQNSIYRSYGMQVRCISQ